MTRTELRHYRGYLFKLLKDVGKEFPEYEVKAGDGLPKLLKKYFTWVDKENKRFLPQSEQNNSDAVWLTEQYAIWLNN